MANMMKLVKSMEETIDRKNAEIIELHTRIGRIAKGLQIMPHPVDDDTVFGSKFNLWFHMTLMPIVDSERKLCEKHLEKK